MYTLTELNALVQQLNQLMQESEQYVKNLQLAVRQTRDVLKEIKRSIPAIGQDTQAALNGKIRTGAALLAAFNAGAISNEAPALGRIMKHLGEYMPKSEVDRVLLEFFTLLRRKYGDFCTPKIPALTGISGDSIRQWLSRRNISALDIGGEQPWR